MGSPVGAGSVPAVTTLTLSPRRKATPFRIILWRCWARSEHGIARLRRMIRVGVVCYGAPADPRARTVQCWTRTAGSVILLQLTGTPAALLIVLPHPKKAGSSDAPEPLSSNDVAATMALNSVRISGWCRPR